MTGSGNGDSPWVSDRNRNWNGRPHESVTGTGPGTLDHPGSVRKIRTGTGATSASETGTRVPSASVCTVFPVAMANTSQFHEQFHDHDHPEASLHQDPDKHAVNCVY